MDPERFDPSPAPPWQWWLLSCGRTDPGRGIETAVRALPLGLGDRVRFWVSERAFVAGLVAELEGAVAAGAIR